MRKKTFIFASALAILFAACTKEENNVKRDSSVKVTAEIYNQSQKNVNNTWDSDKIGVMAVLPQGTTMYEKYKNVGYQTSSIEAQADFSPIADGIFFENANEEYTFAAYAPFVASKNSSTLPGDNGKIAINTLSQSSAADQKNLDILYAIGAKASKKSPLISFTDNTATGGENCSFKHKMSRLILKVQVSDKDGFSDATILKDANYGLGGLIHEGVFDITSGLASATGNLISNWELQTYDKTSKKHTNNCIAEFNAATGIMTLTMILLPQTLTNSLNFDITLNDTDAQSFSNNTMIKPSLEAGYSYTYTITIKKTSLSISENTIENWNDGGSYNVDAKMQ